jgi:hypothetical protein
MLSSAASAKLAKPPMQFNVPPSISLPNAQQAITQVMALVITVYLTVPSAARTQIANLVYLAFI